MTKKEALELLKNTNLERIAKMMIDTYDESSVNVALVAQDGELRIIPFFYGTHLKDAIILYVLPLNWEDAYEIEGIQSKLLDELNNPDKVMQKIKEMKKDETAKQLETVKRILAEDINTQWEYEIENGTVVIYKNGEYYDEEDLDSLANKAIDELKNN